jgi:hypothetical protein
MITYYVKLATPEKAPEEEKKKRRKKEEPAPADTLKNEVKQDTVMLEIFKGNELIRTLKTAKPDTSGVYRMYWGMDEKGADYPSRQERNRNGEPGGIDVLPGTYKLRMTFGDTKDSTNIVVRYDPRVEMDRSVLEQQYAWGKTLQGYRQVAADAMKRLRNSMEIAKTYESQMKKLDEDGYKESIDLSKQIQDSISAIMDPIVGAESDKQGIVRNAREVPVTSRISRASGYLYSSDKAPGATEERLRKHAEDAVKEMVDEVNAFFAGPWEDYRRAMQQLDVDPFKEYQPLRLE